MDTTASAVQQALADAGYYNGAIDGIVSPGTTNAIAAYQRGSGVKLLDIAGVVTFVAIADPTRPGHGALAQMGYRTEDTPYDTVYFTREYDGLADLPDRFNVLAIANAAAGIIYLHPYYGELPANLPEKNVTTTVNGAGGKVTDVLIPTAHLPMLQPLRNLGMNVDGLEAVLRPMVNAGYSRNDVKPAPVAVTDTVATESKSEDEPKKQRRNVQASDATHEVKDSTQQAAGNTQQF
jgi:peptidoglycan hydrolase-like protein with peptidoglycan-binding domain